MSFPRTRRVSWVPLIGAVISLAAAVASDSLVFAAISVVFGVILLVNAFRARPVSTRPYRPDYRREGALFEPPEGDGR